MPLRTIIEFISGKNANPQKVYLKNMIINLLAGLVII